MTVIKSWNNFVCIDTNWLVQETSGLNPDYFDDIKSFSKKNENMLFQRNRSNNLLQTGRRETRR